MADKKDHISIAVPEKLGSLMRRMAAERGITLSRLVEEMFEEAVELPVSQETALQALVEGEESERFDIPLGPTERPTEAYSGPKCRIRTKWQGAFATTEFVPDDTIEEGDSYFTENGEYVWSGRYDEKEVEMATDFLLTPDSGQNLYKWDYADAYPEAMYIARLWMDALNRVADAIATGIPIEGHTLVDRAAKWLLWVRNHPNTSSEQWWIVCMEIGISEEEHIELRNALTWENTARAGYLVAEYPWHLMDPINLEERK